MPRGTSTARPRSTPVEPQPGCPFGGEWRGMSSLRAILRRIISSSRFSAGRAFPLWLALTPTIQQAEGTDDEWAFLGGEQIDGPLREYVIAGSVMQVA